MFPERGPFLTDLAGEALLARVEVALQRGLPIGQPGAEFLLQTLHGGLCGFGGAGGCHLLDLRGEPLDFHTLLLGALLGLLAGGFVEPLHALLKCFQAGLAGTQALFP